MEYKTCKAFSERNRTLMSCSTTNYFKTIMNKLGSIRYNDDILLKKSFGNILHLDLFKSSDQY